MSDLYIWGAGGHGRVVFDCALRCGYEPEFIDDDRCHLGMTYCGRTVHLPDAGLAAAGFARARLHIAIGRNPIRAARFLMVLQRGLAVATLIHPAAVVSPSAVIGEGSLVMPGAILNAGARVGRNCIVNTGAIVEHDCQVGDHVHLGPRAALGGGVKVAAGVFLGMGAAVIPGVAIAANAMVGAGAVVIRDVPAGVTVAGVPARILSHSAEEEHL